MVEFAVPADHRVKLKESEKKDKYLDLARKFKKNVKQESNDYTNCNWCSWYNHQRISEGTGRIGNKGMSGDHHIDCIIEISQNTGKSSGDLVRLAVTQTSVKDNQLRLMWKTLKR